MPSSSPHQRHGARRSSLHHRLVVASRALAAILGGYGLATAFTVALGRLLDLPRDEALNTSAMPAFLLYVAAAVWAFSASTATKAWLGIGLPACALALLAWWLRSAPAT